MSTGHRSEAKPIAELYSTLGKGDTPKLYARKVKLDVHHDTPYGGGVSVDGKTVYVDSRLYDGIRNGTIAIRGMTAQQLTSAIIEHEHTEWAIDVGDNPVDTYQGAHGFAAAKEEEFVRDLGVDPERYEAASASWAA
jgi:hypothetical protein